MLVILALAWGGFHTWAMMDRIPTMAMYAAMAAGENSITWTTQAYRKIIQLNSCRSVTHLITRLEDNVGIFQPGPTSPTAPSLRPDRLIHLFGVNPPTSTKSDCFCHRKAQDCNKHNHKHDGRDPHREHFYSLSSVDQKQPEGVLHNFNVDRVHLHLEPTQNNCPNKSCDLDTTCWCVCGAWPLTCRR